MNNSSTPHSSLLDALAPDYLRTLARQGQVRHYRKNTLLIQEGDVGVQLYVVLHGNLREFAMSQDSKPREITLAMAGRGDVLGLLALEGAALLKRHHLGPCCLCRGQRRKCAGVAASRPPFGHGFATAGLAALAFGNPNHLFSLVF